MYKSPEFNKLKYPKGKNKVPRIFEEEKEVKPKIKRLTPQEARDNLLKGENG